LFCCVCVSVEVKTELDSHEFWFRTEIPLPTSPAQYDEYSVGCEKRNSTLNGTPCSAHLLEPLGSSTVRTPHSLRKRQMHASPDPEVSPEKISPSLVVELVHHNKALKGGS